MNRPCLMLWVCLLALAVLLPSLATAQIAILPLSEVKPGMVGEARTVFQGIVPEPFKVRVISILRNFMPKQDIILVRAEDPRLDAIGIAAGMSGSP
ncbi:MAG TPA: SpoIVB peptidase S55, partial [Polyangia bacterium]